MSDTRHPYTVTTTNGPAKVKLLDPERELWSGIRRLLLSAAKMIEVYLERRDRLKST